MKTAISIAGATAALLSLQSASAVSITQLTPLNNAVDTYFILATANNNATHFAQLDDDFVAADLILDSSSGQINTTPQNWNSVDSSQYNYMVVRYEKNGPQPDLIGAFALDNYPSVTRAFLDSTVPAGYDHHQIFLYNAHTDTPPPPPPPRVPDGGATAALLGLGMLGLAAARKALK